jgi:hypothetical protein
MSERLWALIGKIAAIATIIGALVGVIALLSILNAPSSRLVADIRPMAFQLPITMDEILEAT